VRIQPGGRLVEEDEPGVAEEGHGQVEPPLHATRVGRHHLTGRLDQLEPLEQLAGAAATFSSVQVMEVGHQDEVLLAGEQFVHRRELPGDTDGSPHLVGLSGQIEAGDVNVACVGVDERREDPHRGGLARPVRTEQRECRSLGDVEIDAVEHDLVAERLAQAPSLER
jgi:hypothetical protein